jgi:hypothetical protein
LSLFSETIADSLAGAVVQTAILVRLDFTSSDVRLWTGEGVLDANDGTQWYGVGGMGVLDGIEQAIGGTAPEAKIGLAGLNTNLLGLAVDEFETEARNRLAIVYFQFFREDDQRVLDNPYPVWAGEMMRPEFNIALNAFDIVVSAESIFALRSRPPFAMYTDTDQQARFPGDKGFQYTPTLMNKVVDWPVF